jgi:hypothetical protein
VSRRKTGWDTPLPEPIKGIATLRDVRDHILTMNPPSPQWHYIGELALEAAESGDVGDIALALRMFHWRAR